jgi:hypothetical protein
LKEMSMPTTALGLRHFTKDEIYVSQDDARALLRFFFPTEQVPDAGALTDEDRGFAQALLLEAVDKSYAMSFVQDIYDVFYGKVPTGFDVIKDMLKDFVKKAAKTWWDHATGKDLADPKIYNAVKVALTANFRSIWNIRMQTGELTY